MWIIALKTGKNIQEDNCIIIDVPGKGRCCKCHCRKREYHYQRQAQTHNSFYKYFFLLIIHISGHADCLGRIILHRKSIVSTFVNFDCLIKASVVGIEIIEISVRCDQAKIYACRKRCICCLDCHGLSCFQRETTARFYERSTGTSMLNRPVARATFAFVCGSDSAAIAVILTLFKQITRTSSREKIFFAFKSFLHLQSPL